jgi:hypothetical protein
MAVLVLVLLTLLLKVLPLAIAQRFLCTALYSVLSILYTCRWFSSYVIVAAPTAMLPSLVAYHTAVLVESTTPHPHRC